MKKSWGGSRTGAGRKKKVSDQPEVSEEREKGSWGGSRAGAGRKKKPVEEIPQEEEEILEKIPGRFIVKTNMGYYVSENNYSNYKNDAQIFDDFNEANRVKKNFGGKVVKL